MKLEETLLCHSLEELVEMLADATKQLLESKRKDESAEDIELNKRLVETIQKAIVAKQTADRP